MGLLDDLLAGMLQRARARRRPLASSRARTADQPDQLGGLLQAIIAMLNDPRDGGSRASSSASRRRGSVT